MQRAYRYLLLALLTVAVAVASPVAAQSEQNWSFDNIDRIELDGVSGNLEVVVASGSSITLRLDQQVEPRDTFRGEVEQNGSTLSITEHWGHGSSRGEVRWVLAVPAALSPTIEMESASGGVEVSGVAARFELDTASGDFEMRDGTLMAGSDIDTASGDLCITAATVQDGVDMSTASGDVEISNVDAGRNFDFSTASGNVRVQGSRGVLEGSSASGDVDVEVSALGGVGDFSSASGDVTVRLNGSLTNDFEASSASGNVEFRADFGDDFTLVITVREDRGRIDSPFRTTSKETFKRNGQTYVRETVQRGSGGPEIRLNSASGRVRVRERS